jgi:hypothetical protein
MLVWLRVHDTCPVLGLNQATVDLPGSFHWSDRRCRGDRGGGDDDVVRSLAFENVTLRQIVHLTAGGRAVRVRLDNTFAAIC